MSYRFSEYPAIKCLEDTVSSKKPLTHWKHIVIDH